MCSVATSEISVKFILRPLFWAAITWVFTIPLFGLHIVSLPILLMFFYVDLFGLDGGSIYPLFRLLGGKSDFEGYVGLLLKWKPPLLMLQVLSLVYRPLLLFLGVIELAFFYYTFRKFGMSVANSLLLDFIILLAMYPLFLSKNMVTLFIELLSDPDKYLFLLM